MSEKPTCEEFEQRVKDLEKPELPDHISTRTSGIFSTFQVGSMGRWVAWMVLLAALLITFNAWYFARNEAIKSAQAHFEYHVKTIETRVYERFQAYEFLLRGGSGLFAASDEVTREDWRAYVTKLQVNQYYPGIQGVGFSKRILPSEKSAHLRQIRGEGFPQYTITPDGERPEYTSIIFLEPFDWRNQRAFGYDMFSEPIRKEAMIRARDTGIAVLSGKVTLVQETAKDIQTGFLIYLAIYRKGEPLETPEQRRKALMGYVYSPFRMDDFMKGIIAEKEGYVKLQIFDGDKPLKETLLYRSDAAEESHSHPEVRHFATHQSILEYSGHRWLLSFVSSKYFEENIETGSTNFILLLGITISLLLFGMVLFLTNSHNQAIALANTTLDLEKANIGLRKEIMERKQAEEALHKEKHFAYSLIQTAQTIILLLDTTGHIVNINPYLEDISGYRLKEVQGKDWFSTFLPEYKRDLVRELFLNAISDIQTRGNVSPIVTKDGRELQIEWYDKTLKDESGNIKGLLSIGQDVSERKRAEEGLRESREKYQELTESISDVFFAMDKNLRHTHWNKASEILTGIPIEKAVGKTLMEVFPDNEAREQVKKMYLRIIETKKPEQLIVKYPGNERIVHEISAYPTIEGVSVFIKDITERKKMEEELLRSQKLESVGVLAGGIAHDFNNILTTILGNISLARMQVSTEDELFDLLREAETASTRAQLLTKQLLTFAKGGTPLKEIASIKEILKESSAFVLRGSKSGCEFSIAEDLWPAEIDVGQMSQVISNIVINANQAMPEGGIIQVAAENLMIEDRHGLPVKPGRYVRISIKDQGVGIAQKHLLNIFDPYFTTKHQGSGLGLATTYSIVKKHEGHITVESQLGVGTTFHIYLPASDQAVPKKEETRLIKGQGRILVMDDEASLRKVVGRMLENLGYESEFAKDGAEAIEIYKAAKEVESPYDAVILDLTIPGGMGGKEAINKLLEIDPEIKAIVSSGYSDDPVLSNFQEYGFKGMLPKPFESRSLGKVLYEVIEGEDLGLSIVDCRLLIVDC